MPEGTQTTDVTEVKDISQEVAEAQADLDRVTFDAPAEVQNTVEQQVSEDIEAAVAESIPTREEAAPQKTAEASVPPDVEDKNQAAGEQALDNAITSQIRSQAASADTAADSHTDDTQVIESPEKKEGGSELMDKGDPAAEVQAVSDRGSESYEESMEGAQPGELRGFTETSEDDDWALSSDGTVTPPDLLDRAPLQDNTAPGQDGVSPIVEDPKLPIDQGESDDDDQDTDSSASAREVTRTAPATASVEEMVDLNQPVESAAAALDKATSGGPGRPDSGLDEREGKAIPEPSVSEVEPLSDLSIVDPDESDEYYDTLMKQRQEQRNKQIEEAQDKVSDHEVDTSLIDLILYPGRTVMEDGIDTESDGQSKDEADQRADFEEFTESLESYMNDYPQGNIMASLFHIFKESIEENNEDKQYFLSKLADMNLIAEAQGDYLKELNDAIIIIEAAEGGEDSESGSDSEGFYEGDKYSPDWSDDYKGLVDRITAVESALSDGNVELTETVEKKVWDRAVPIKKDTNIYELTKNVIQSEAQALSLEEEEQVTAVVLARTGNTVRSTVTELQKESKDLSTDEQLEHWSTLLDTQPEIKNKRQKFQTMFENFDQKANQLYNTLSAVLKSIEEMRSSTDRNEN